MKKKLIIGTRGSQLALWQTNHILGLIKEQFPEIDVDLRVINTKGDKIIDTELHKIGDKGLFTKELEYELLKGTIDAAVHSLKDMQTDMPDGLCLAAITKRHNPVDVLISKEKNASLTGLKNGAVIATGSLRRKAQLLALRNDFVITGLRGNLNTRLKKFEDSSWDAIVLAAAGVERLGMESYITQYIPADVVIPAAGQGALGIQIRCNDTNTEELFAGISDNDTTICTTAERAFLKAMGGGCRMPMAAYAQIKDKKLSLIAMAASIDGSEIIRETYVGDIVNPELAGTYVAGLLLSKGAGSFIIGK
jgi:hydroxymethylbilane synthase